MSASSTKRRILNFRLTEEEYQILRDASRNIGARTLSDFARSVLLKRFDMESEKVDTTARIDVLQTRISALENRVEELCSALKSSASNAAVAP